MVEHGQLVSFVLKDAAFEGKIEFGGEALGEAVVSISAGGTGPVEGRGAQKFLERDKLKPQLNVKK